MRGVALPLRGTPYAKQRDRPSRDDARLAPGLRTQPTLSVTVSAVRALHLALPKRDLPTSCVGGNAPAWISRPVRTPKLRQWQV